jgi:hypothetical protein
MTVTRKLSLRLGDALSRHRTVLRAIGLLALVLLLGTCTLGYFIKREPAFYAAAAKKADFDTREKAYALLTRIQDLKNDIRTSSKWGETFTAEELNCFFSELMTEKASFTGLLPDGFHSPRVAIDGDLLKIGFRYGHGFWSTVIWIELRVWLVAEETNLFAIEVCNLKAGKLGIGTQSILDSIGDAARGSNIDVTWYRSNGNAVGLFRFLPDQPRPASQLLKLDVSDNKITIVGRSVSTESTATAAP